MSSTLEDGIILIDRNYLACGLSNGNRALEISNVPVKFVLAVTSACSASGAVDAF